MKNKIISLGIAIIASLTVLGQSPQNFNYQTIVRNADGNPVQNQSVGFRMSIYEVDINTYQETLEYQETHSVTTNEFGLVTFYIGGGTVVSGSLSGIIWGTENFKLLQVGLDINGGSNYSDMGYSPLVSVPYALYAESTADIDEIVNFAGDTKINMPFNDKSIRFISEDDEKMRLTNTGRLGIGTQTPNAELEVVGSIRMNDGTQAAGRVMVSDYIGVASWADLPSSDDNDWTISGNNMYSSISGNVGIGTTSPGAKLEVAGRIWQTGIGNSVFIGEGAGANDDLSNNTNVFIGRDAGKTNTTGSNNIAIGGYSLNSNSTGAQNIAIGYSSLVNNTTGFGNIAFGSNALNSNTIGNYNYATGEYVLYSNTSGSFNIATGVRALLFNTEGSHNIANGYFSLHHNTTGNDNIASGKNALVYNTIGSNNIATGKYALFSNTTGHSNVSIGVSALYKNTDRSNLVAIGDSALYHNGEGASGDYAATMNTAVGAKALYSNTTGRENTANGFEALYYNTEGPLNTAIGSKALHANTTGYYNTALGSEALYSNTVGGSNTAIGVNALNYNSSGSGNIAIGSAALYQNDAGNKNIAIGVNSLRNNEGHSNIANGYQALYSNTTGSSNVAIGINALYSNTNKSNIVAIGDSALFHNGVGAPGTYAIENTAVGSKALYTNTTGYNNTATGYKSLYSNTGGWNNNAFGDEALYSNEMGSNNNAMGNGALDSNISGSGNVAVGTSSLYDNIAGEFNTAIGHLSGVNSTGSYNVFIGNRAGQHETGSSKLYISNSDANQYNALIYGEFDNHILKFNAQVQLTKSTGNEMVIKNDNNWEHSAGNQDFGNGGDHFIMASKEGATESAGIYGDGDIVTIWSAGDYATGQPSAYLYILDEDNFDSDGDPYNNGALQAYVNTSGNWVSVSDKNKKENIKPLSSSLDKLMSINAYSYNLKQSDEDKAKNTNQEATLGVLAQEVEQVFPEVIEKSDAGDYYVSYSEFIPVLIDAVKEQQQTIESLQQSIKDLENQVNQLNNK